MKKLYSIIALILVFTFVLPLVSCNQTDGRTNIKKVSDALSKLETLQSIDSEVTLKLYIGNELSYTAIPITLGIKANKTGKDASLSLSIPMMISTITAYVTEETVLLDAFDGKYALAVNGLLSSIQNMIPSAFPETELETFPESAPATTLPELSLDEIEGYAPFITYIEGTFNSAKPTTLGGVTTIDVTYKSSDVITKLVELLKGMLKNSELLALIEAEVNDPETMAEVKQYIESFSAEQISSLLPSFDITLTFKIDKNDYLIKAAASIALTSSGSITDPQIPPLWETDGDNDETTDANSIFAFLTSLAKLEFSVEFKNPGSAVTITPPENLDAYTEITLESLYQMLFGGGTEF